MISLAIQCKNRKCKEVFHRYDVIFPLINDFGYIDIKCSRCATVNRVPIHNPVPYGFGDNYEIVGAAEIESKEDWNKLVESSKNRITTVEGYEHKNDPLHKWKTYADHSLWKDGEINYEIISEYELNICKTELSDLIKRYYNAMLAGQLWAPDVQKIFVFKEYMLNGIQYQSIWAKECQKEKDYNSDELYLIHHSGCHNLIDGIYPRDLLLFYLERLLVRWKMTSTHVVIASPFIGFDLKYSKPEDIEEISYLWDYLNGLQDVRKTTFLTRVSSYTSLKKAQGSTKELKKWDLMTDMQDKFHDKKTRDEAKEKFHFKLYAGIKGNNVELYIGSYNIQTGKTLENMELRTISLSEFTNNYMNNILEDFKIDAAEQEDVLCLFVDSNNKISYKIHKSNMVASMVPSI